LIRVDEDHARHVQREQHVQEQDLVGPDDALLVRLLVQPVRPLVRDKLILKAVLLCHGGNDALVVRRHVVGDDPELDPAGTHA
jgi:hypothetical protein